MIGGSILTDNLSDLIDEYNKVKENKKCNSVEFEKIKQEILCYKLLTVSCALEIIGFIVYI